MWERSTELVVNFQSLFPPSFSFWTSSLSRTGIMCHDDNVSRFITRNHIFFYSDSLHVLWTVMVTLLIRTTRPSSVFFRETKSCLALFEWHSDVGQGSVGRRLSSTHTQPRSHMWSVILIFIWAIRSVLSLKTWLFFNNWAVTKTVFKCNNRIWLLSANSNHFMI